MKLYFIIFSVCILGSSCKTSQDFSQEAEDQRIEKLNFPVDWSGKWRGDLKVYSGLGLQYTIKMELHLIPQENSENYDYTIIYDSPERFDKRLYELIVVDQSQGLYLLDEKNTILIESYFMGGKWFQRFDVVENLLVCSIEQIGNQLVWEITSGKTEAISTSGDTSLEDIFEVNTYPVGVYQKAVLSKYQ